MIAQAPDTHSVRSRLSEMFENVSRRLWSLDRIKLCCQARRRTGLQDFGDPPIQPALSVLVASLEEEAELSPLGRFLMRAHLLGLLETRLRLTAFWRDKNYVLDGQRIDKPIFIVGMPRSGSTFLHELLTDNPDHRAPRAWEVMFPVPSGEGRIDQTKRICKMEACLWCFRRLAPRADAVYPMRALTPHECVAIHSYTFLSEEFISTCRVPRYEGFLHSSDLAPVYQWEKRFLQHLQLGSPARRWILKSPDHVYGLKELFSTFPDATIIQTHRNPVEVVKSSADLTAVLRGLYGPSGTDEDLRVREARVLAQATERFLHFRDSHPELAHRFIDVRYTDLIADPVSTVRRIYEQLESPFTNVLSERMRQLASNRSRYRGRRASAEPAGLKLATALEGVRFERYCARFQLSFQEPELKK